MKFVGAQITFHKSILFYGFVAILLANIISTKAAPWNLRGIDQSEEDLFPASQTDLKYNANNVDKLLTLLKPNRQYSVNGIRSLPLIEPIRGGHVKRQVRYHQCYFNPISCFGMRR